MPTMDNLFLTLFWFLRLRYFNEKIETDSSISISGTSRVWNSIPWKAMLRVSLEPKDAGGYPAYFRDTPWCIPISKDGKSSVEIPGSKGFVSQIDQKYRMSLNRFKQIRGAFHPECCKQGKQQGDKCYQLRKAINHLNVAAIMKRITLVN